MNLKLNEEQIEKLLGGLELTAQRLASVHDGFDGNLLELGITIGRIVQDIYTIKDYILKALKESDIKKNDIERSLNQNIDEEEQVDESDQRTRSEIENTALSERIDALNEIIESAIKSRQERFKYYKLE